MHLHAEALGGGGKATEFGPAVLIGREPEATRHLPAGRQSGLGVEPLVEINRILQDLCDRG